MTHLEIAKVLGVTQSCVAKIEQRALRKLRWSPTLYLAYVESQNPWDRRSRCVGTLYHDEVAEENPNQ